MALCSGQQNPRKLWEKFNSEARGDHFTSSLFADDTTLLGEEKEMQAAVPKIKETMEEFEEKNNSSKEERMVFGDILGEKNKNAWMLDGDHRGPKLKRERVKHGLKSSNN